MTKIVSYGVKTLLTLSLIPKHHCCNVSNYSCLKLCIVRTQGDRTEAVAEQVRATLKPFFKSGMIDKDAYKEIMRKAVPKVLLHCVVNSFSVE